MLTTYPFTLEEVVVRFYYWDTSLIVTDMPESNDGYDKTNLDTDAFSYLKSNDITTAGLSIIDSTT